MSNTNIQEIMKDIERVMEATHTVVETMQVGDRKQLKVLAQEVAALVSKSPKEIVSFVNHFAHNTSIAYVSRGKNGGIVRGVRQFKVVKAGKKSKSAGATDTATE
jgi:hypothetical protein